MANFASLDETRSALNCALGKVTGKTGANQPLPSANAPSIPSANIGSASGLQRQKRSGGVLVSPHLLQLKVQIEKSLRQTDAYMALPVGQIATLPSRLSTLKTVLASVETMLDSLKTVAIDEDILASLASAAVRAREAYDRLQHMGNMYGAAAGDPGFHWRLIAGLIGGHSPSSGRKVWVQGLSPDRLLEYLNPQRMYDWRWEGYINQWLMAVDADETKEPFFLWFEANGETMQGKGTTYLDDAMRAAALVTLRNGQLWRLQAQNQGPAVEVPFTSSVFNSDRTEEYHMFMAYCLDEFGVLYVYPHNEAEHGGLTDIARANMAKAGNIPATTMRTAQLFHSSGHRGEPVAGAGMIRTYEGKVVAITTKSGHYWPTLEMFVQTLAYLESTLDQAMAHFAFSSSDGLKTCCTKATEFLRLARHGFPPKETSDFLMFGDMNMRSGELDAENLYSGKTHFDHLQEFLETYSRFGQSEARRVIEEQRIAHRTRLEIYRGRTLDPTVARNFEKTVMSEVVMPGKTYVLGATPFDDTPLDAGAAQRNADRIDALEQGQKRGRARANNLLRFNR